jgi:hypothetical protein
MRSLFFHIQSKTSISHSSKSFQISIFGIFCTDPMPLTPVPLFPVFPMGKRYFPFPVGE